MARLPYPDPANTPEPVREALGALPPLNIFRMLAHAETAFRPYLRYGGAILADLQLDPQLRELAILQVAKQAGAEYEWVQHVAIAGYVGLADEQVNAVRLGQIDADQSLTELQRSVLAFTTEVVAGPKLSEETFASVKQSLSPREIVELLLTIGNYLALARVMTTLEIEIDVAAGSEVMETLQSQSTSPS